MYVAVRAIAVDSNGHVDLIVEMEAVARPNHAPAVIANTCLGVWEVATTVLQVMGDGHLQPADRAFTQHQE